MSDSDRKREYFRGWYQRLKRGEIQLPELDWAVCARGGSEAQAKAHYRRGQKPCANCLRAAARRRRAARALVACTLIVFMVTAALQLHHTPPSEPAPQPALFDTDTTRLLLPDPYEDSGTICYPFMNLLRLQGCPQVLV